jgi:carotenoid cleavage dioxygenase
MSSPKAHDPKLSPYLQGDYAPIAEESSFEHADLEIIGEIPRDLSGVFVRNGPNARHTPIGRYHWFDGDGMLHALRFEDGKASYRNRWVRTAHLAEEESAGRALWSGLLESTRDNPGHAPYKDTANTDLALLGDRLYALWYICGVPYRVDPATLETYGPESFGRERPLPISAHTKTDEHSTELMFFNYGPRPPFMHYGVVDKEGRMQHLTPIELAGPRLPHDMAITENYSILMDLPVFFRPEALREKRWLVDFYRDLPSRFGVIPRHGDGSEIRWFEAEPCYIYHTINAWEEGDRIVMVGCRVAEPIPAMRKEDGEWARMMANLRIEAHLHRWTFDLKTGQCREEKLDDINSEFPTMNKSMLGRKTRYSYNSLLADTSTLRFEGIVKYDTESMAQERHPWGPGRWGSEAPFAPRDGAQSEDDGYLVSFVHDADKNRSEVAVLDARNISRGPVARILLPTRVPLGFHACWVPADRLQGDR